MFSKRKPFNDTDFATTRCIANTFDWTGCHNNSKLRRVMDEQASTTRTSWRCLLSLLFCYHALAVSLGTLIPHESHLHAVLDPLFRPYLTLSGSDQIWNMFTSAPYYARYDVVLAAEDRAGIRHEYGPVLPGLRTFDTTNYREHKLFGTLGRRTYASALSAYFDGARHELETRHVAVRSLRLRYKTQRLHKVADVRKTGEISFSDISETEPRTWQ
jgi:hypothetical protein